MEGIEVFIQAPSHQKCLDIDIFINFPFTIINFKKEDTIMALCVLEIKTISGYADKDNFNVFLNNNQIELEYFEKMFEKNKKFIKSENTISIEHKTNKNITYFEQMIAFPYKEKNNRTYLKNEIER